MINIYKPILFNTQMVRAIREGRKTETRRLIDPQPKNNVVLHCGTWQEDKACANGLRVFTPKYKVGDILWVRETWSFWPCFDCDNEMCYGGVTNYEGTDGCFVYKTQNSKVPYDEKWHPSINMPKKAAREFLKVTAVRAEPLQNITENGAIAEGLYHGPMIEGSTLMCEARPSFISLWDRTVNPKKVDRYGWDANPWVWVYQFERCDKPKEWI